MNPSSDELAVSHRFPSAVRELVGSTQLPVSTQILHLVELKTSLKQGLLKIRDNPRNPCNPRFAAYTPKCDLHSGKKPTAYPKNP